MFTSKTINVIHLLIIGPLLTYIGLQGKNTSKIMFNILTLLGLFVIGYHGYNLYKKMNGNITLDTVRGTLSNTVGDIRNTILGKDDKGNTVMVDQHNNVSVIDVSGRVMAHNDAVAHNSAKQAMANNAAH